jgi:hypothetical protein
MSYDAPSPEQEEPNPADEKIDEHGSPTDDALPEVGPTDLDPDQNGQGIVM